MISGLAILGLIFSGIVFLFVVVIIWSRLSHTIPITILRYNGSKDRPTMISTKGKKVTKNGITKLKVLGYPNSFRDYLSHNYFPSPKGKHGGLILWEFEDAMLTPSISEKEYKELTKEQKQEYDEVKQKISEMTKKPVPFDFDDELLKELRLKAVDDVDIDWMLEQYSRVDKEYDQGFWGFLNKHGSTIAIIFIAILMLVGLLQWFENMPEFAAQCYGAAERIVEQSMLEQAADKMRPAG